MFLIFLILILILITLKSKDMIDHTGGTVMGPFSYLTEDISDGNPASYAKVVNKGSLRYDRRMEHGDGIATFYGHGIPLAHETRLPGPFDKGSLLLPHNLNPKCSPECCPSPYSCDRGCLCYAMTNLPWT